MKLKLLIFTLSIAVFISCTIQKRTHRNGYYIDWHKKSTNKIFERNAIKTDFVASTDDKIILPKSEGLSFAAQPVEACGDTLFLLNGTKIICNVIEINGESIKYKQCDNIDGPLYSTNKNELTKIKYNNGTSEYFTKSSKRNDEAVVKNSCNDTLILNSGKIIYCEILNEKGDYIKYKKCDSLNNSEFYIEKQKIKTIKKVNSNEEPLSKLDDTEYTGKRKIHPLTLGSFILANLIVVFYIAGLYVGASALISLAILLYLTTIILAIISIVKITKNRKRYKGIGFSIFSIILPPLAVITLFALIVLLFGF